MVTKNPYLEKNNENFFTSREKFIHFNLCLRQCHLKHYKLCFSIFIVPPVALTKAQVAIFYFFLIAIVSSIKGMTKNSSTIWRELRVQFPIVLVEQKPKHWLNQHKGVKLINISSNTSVIDNFRSGNF